MKENRTFWETVKSFLTEKINKTSIITLTEEEWVIFQDHLIAKTFNEYFISIPIKNMPKNPEYESFGSSEENTVSSIIKKYQNHPSIKSIKTKNKSKNFRFSETNTDDIKKLDPKNLIWHKHSFKNAAYFAEYICDDINTLIRSSKFHNELKEADIVPVHKKKSKFSKEI